MNGVHISERVSRLAASNAAGITAALALLSEADASVLIFEGPYTGGYTLEPEEFFVLNLSFDPTSSSAKLVYSSDPVFNFACIGQIGSTRFVEGDLDASFVGSDLDETWFALSRLSEGASIGASNTSTTSSPLPRKIDATDYTDGDIFYVGYGFRSSGSSDSYNYGWAEVSFEGTLMTLHRWAYETDPGESITIPEPASAAMLFTGLCVAAWSARKRFTRKRITR